MNDQGTGRNLRLMIPVKLALGSTIKLGSRLTFEIALHGRNVDVCELIIESDTNIFEVPAQRIWLEFMPHNMDRNVEVSLDPIAVTEKPVYVSIKAVSDTMTQAAGFFVQVVAPSEQDN